MSESIRKNLALLTLVAALVGGLTSILFREKVHHAPPMTEDELLRALELGSNLPVIAVSRELTKRFSTGAAATGRNVTLDAADGARIDIPDKYAVAAQNCGTQEPWFARSNLDYGGVWFRGTATGAPHTVRLDQQVVAGTATFEGSVYRCQGDQVTVASTGFTVDLPLEQVSPDKISVHASHAWIAYPAAIADLFIAFLLMVFIPTLTLSIIKAIIDSAQSEAGASGLFRYSFRYFGFTTLLAGVIGSIAGYLCYLAQPPATNLREIAAVSIGGKPVMTEYDPHPILNQLINIIPTNPLGALSNPDGNKGLQVAFTAVMIGILLAVIGPEQRVKASEFLKKSLALIVRDGELKWRALSDWTDLLTPVGVFFISVTFCANASYDFLRQMGNVVLCIFGALIVHTVILTTWILVKRDWDEWFHGGLRPGIPGLITALATSSSYAALPGIASVDLLARDSSRRGTFDLCTTINKNGTTIYIATVATYSLFDHLHGTINSMAIVVLLLSGLASLATAGLPLAAVFGLRMVLLASGSPGALAWVIIPLDPLVDRFVTVVNVFANLAACSSPKPLRNDLGAGTFISLAESAGGR